MGEWGETAGAHAPSAGQCSPQRSKDLGPAAADAAQSFSASRLQTAVREISFLKAPQIVVRCTWPRVMGPVISGRTEARTGSRWGHPAFTHALELRNSS